MKFVKEFLKGRLIMQRKIIDWKYIAESYYEKAVSLAILLLLFAFLVSPNIEVKPFDRVIKLYEMIEIPPEIRERIKPPDEIIKPMIEIVIEDDQGEDEYDELVIVHTIPKTTLDPNVEQDKRIFGNTKEWTIYEVEPFPIKQITPIYPEFAKRSGIEGEVFLKVEVFEDGSVGAIKVLKSLMSGPGGLDEAAIKAVRQWEFEPAKSGGQPIAVWVTFSVTFSLE